jgi:hypothetical protein
MGHLKIAGRALAGILAAVSANHAMLTSHTTAPSGGIGIRLVDVPASSSSDPLARSYIVDRMAPGSSIRREVQISNTTRSTADVAVYPAGASSGPGGILFAPGRGQNQLSSWTSVSQGLLRLAAGTDTVDTVTVTVPKNAAGGEDTAVIWAQVSAPSSSQSGVLLVNRVGIRMYISIGLGGTPRPSFSIGPMSANRSATGQPLVVATVRNTGQGLLDIGGNLTLSDGPGGIRGGPFPVTLSSPLAPGGSELATVMLKKAFPDGPWNATLRLTSGPSVRSASATLTFPGVGAAAPAPGRSDVLIVVVTILLVVLACAARALQIFVHRARMRRRGRLAPVRAIAR